MHLPFPTLVPWALAALLPLLVEAKLEPRAVSGGGVSHFATSTNDAWHPFRTSMQRSTGHFGYERLCGADLQTTTNEKDCTGLRVQFFQDNACSQTNGSPAILRAGIPASLPRNVGSFKILAGKDGVTLMFSRLFDIPAAVANGLAIDLSDIKASRRRRGGRGGSGAGGCIVSPFVPWSATVVTPMVYADASVMPHWDTSNNPFLRSVKGAPKTVQMTNMAGVKVELYSGAGCSGSKTQLNVLRGGAAQVCTPVPDRAGNFRSVKVLNVPLDTNREPWVNVLGFSAQGLSGRKDDLVGTVGCGNKPTRVTGLTDKTGRQTIAGTCFERSDTTQVGETEKFTKPTPDNQPIKAIWVDLLDMGTVAMPTLSTTSSPSGHPGRGKSAGGNVKHG